MKKTVKMLAVAMGISLFLCSCGRGDVQPVINPQTSEHESESEQTEPTNPPLKREESGHKKTVIIDPGHGFGDVGCGGPDSKIGVYEYELTLTMAKRLKSSLESLGYIVYLTHDGNEFPSLSELCLLADGNRVEYDASKTQWEDNNIFSPYERVIYMNCLDAMYGVDFAISVHVNANAESEELCGFDLDYCKENEWSSQSWETVKKIRSMANEYYPERDLYLYADTWDDAFVVTKYNSMPSALFETAYSTNDGDAALLKNEQWRNTLMDNLARAIADGIQ